VEIEKKPQTEKEWKTPELIVLVRSRPEEAVLVACKNDTVGGGYFALNTQCWYSSHAPPDDCAFMCLLNLTS